MLQRYRDLQDIIAILGVDELSEEDKLIVSRAERSSVSSASPSSSPSSSPARKASTPSCAETLKSFDAICNGEADDLPSRRSSMSAEPRRRAGEGEGNGEVTLLFVPICGQAETHGLSAAKLNIMV